MKFLANLLHIDPGNSGGIRYFLLLTQRPNDGRLENRAVVEGVYIGYSDAESLMAALRQAKISGETIRDVINSPAPEPPLTFVGVLELTSEQIRTLGFITLAHMIEVLELQT